MNETSVAHKWMETESSVALSKPELFPSVSGGESESLIPTFIPPDNEPFTPTNFVKWWFRNRRRLTIILLLLTNLLLASYLLYAYLFSPTGFSFFIFSVICCSYLAVGIGYYVISDKVKNEEERRIYKAIVLYLESSGWTFINEKFNEKYSYERWIKDFGLGRGFLQVKFFRSCHVSGECDEQTYNHLTANLRRIKPDLEFLSLARFINFSELPADEIRAEDLGYGQGGWIGNGAILGRYGNPAYSLNFTAKIHNKAFVRQRRSATSNVYLVSCAANPNSSEQAKAEAFMQAWLEGAPAGTEIAVIYDRNPERLMATLHVLEDKCRVLDD